MKISPARTYPSEMSVAVLKPRTNFQWIDPPLSPRFVTLAYILTLPKRTVHADHHSDKARYALWAS